MNPRMKLDMLSAGKHRNPLGVAASNAMGAYDDKARGMQEALVQLLQERGASGAPNVHMGSMRDTASRMAASPEALMGLKAVPAVAALAGLGLKMKTKHLLTKQWIF